MKFEFSHYDLIWNLMNQLSANEAEFHDGWERDKRNIIAVKNSAKQRSMAKPLNQRLRMIARIIFASLKNELLNNNP